MRKTNLLAAFLGLTLALHPDSSAADRTRYKDKDWNESFVESCGLHRPNSIQRVTLEGDQKLQVTLQRGDIGQCSTDNKARHRAPFWERAEVSQSNSFRTGHRYRISAEVTFLQGFTGDRETFFQIHGWATDCTKAYPPVMMKFRNGKLAIETLRGASASHPGNHRNALRKKILVTSLYGKPLTLALEFDTRTQPGKLSVSLSGSELISDAPVSFAPCAIPHIKFGIYRPGGQGSQTSQVLFDDLQVTKTK